METLRAVLTGDLIDSRRGGTRAVEDSMQALTSAGGSLGTLLGFDPRFTRFRGDGWQILLPRPRLSLIACLALTASLRAARTGLASRIAVGVGPVVIAGTQNLGDANGPAFEVSGDLLAHLSADTARERMMIDGDGITKWQQGTLALADWIAQGWTPPQAEAVAMVLLDDDCKTNERRAKALGVSRQAFEARLRGSGLDAMSIARGAFWGHDFTANAE